MSWQKMYNSGEFRITTNQPSKIVVRGLQNELNKFKRLADLGCGKGRNSIYAAGLGYSVDAVDTVNLKILKGLDPSVRERIRFHKRYVMDFEIEENSYGNIIMTRLIQYISPEDLKVLFCNVSTGLVNKGQLIMNYVESGGFFSSPGSSIQVYSHSIINVTRMLERSGLKISYMESGAKTSLYTNHDLPIKSYDILAEKK